MLKPIQDNDNYKPHEKIIQIYPCLLKLSHDGRTDRQTDRQMNRRTDGETATITISLTAIAEG